MCRFISDLICANDLENKSFRVWCSLFSESYIIENEVKKISKKINVDRKLRGHTTKKRKSINVKSI